MATVLASRLINLGGLAASTARTVFAEGIRLPGIGRTGIGISLRSNIRAEAGNINRLLRDHDDVTVMALNRTARSARTQTIRQLAPALNVPQKVLRKRIRVYPARRNRKPLRSSLWVGTRKAIKAAELTGSVSVGPSGVVKIGKRTFRQAFPARMPSGHRGIFVRQPHARHKRRPDGQMTQLPIAEGVVNLMPEAEDISRREARAALQNVFPREQARLMRVRAARRRR